MAHLGWFLSRRCFMLCITMEAEPRIAKQYKCQHCCSCKNCQGKAMEGGKKVSLHRFLADQKIASSWKKCVLGHPTGRFSKAGLLEWMNFVIFHARSHERLQRTSGPKSRELTTPPEPPNNGNLFWTETESVKKSYILYIFVAEIFLDRQWICKNKNKNKIYI